MEFSSKEAVDVLLLNPHHTLCGKKVCVPEKRFLAGFF